MSKGEPHKPMRIDAKYGRRIAAAVLKVEAGSAPGRGGRVVASNWYPGVVRAVVTTAIPTGTFSSPSTAGRAQIYHKDASRTWAVSGDPAVVVNDHTLSASIAVGKAVKLAWVDGDWYLIAADC